MENYFTVLGKAAPNPPGFIALGAYPQVFSLNSFEIPAQCTGFIGARQGDPCQPTGGRGGETVSFKGDLKPLRGRGKTETKNRKIMCRP